MYSNLICIYVSIYAASKRGMQTPFLLLKGLILARQICGLRHWHVCGVNDIVTRPSLLKGPNYTAFESLIPTRNHYEIDSSNCTSLSSYSRLIIAADAMMLYGISSRISVRLSKNNDG